MGGNTVFQLGGRRPSCQSASSDLCSALAPPSAPQRLRKHTNILISFSLRLKHLLCSSSVSQLVLSSLFRLWSLSPVTVCRVLSECLNEGNKLCCSKPSGVVLFLWTAAVQEIYSDYTLFLSDSLRTGPRPQFVLCSVFLSESTSWGFS